MLHTVQVLNCEVGVCTSISCEPKAQTALNTISDKRISAEKFISCPYVPPLLASIAAVHSDVMSLRLAVRL